MKKLAAQGVDPFDVDVVVPVRNGARHIAHALDSIMAQTRPPRSVLVVDYDSTDGTPEIVEGYARRCPVLRLVRAVKRGLPHGRNLGVAKCDSPFVAFLDSDDVWEPTKLERQMALFSIARPLVGFIHCAYYKIDDQGHRIENCHIVQPKKRTDLLRDLLVEGNDISGSGSAVVVRREALQRVGGFDERLTYAEDWDAWLRLAEICDVDFVPEPLVGIREHSESMQFRDFPGKEEQFLLQKLLILDRWYEQPNFPPQLRDEYRRLVVELAISEAALRLPRQLELFRKIKFGDSRFGRDLFSSQFDFCAEVCRTLPKVLIRRPLAKILKSGLSPAQFEALRKLVR
jgi:glycosyltransferase involved in cell wall biosynthesis